MRDLEYHSGHFRATEKKKGVFSPLFPEYFLEEFFKPYLRI